MRRGRYVYDSRFFVHVLFDEKSAFPPLDTSSLVLEAVKCTRSKTAPGLVGGRMRLHASVFERRCLRLMLRACEGVELHVEEFHAALYNAMKPRGAIYVELTTMDAPLFGALWVLYGTSTQDAIHPADEIPDVDAMMQCHREGRLVPDH
jgi:hypothetical protein